MEEVEEVVVVAQKNQEKADRVRLAISSFLQEEGGRRRRRRRRTRRRRKKDCPFFRRYFDLLGHANIKLDLIVLQRHNNAEKKTVESEAAELETGGV